MRRAAALLAVTAAAVATAGCGDDGDGKRPRLIVSAASSLTGALTECGRAFPAATVRPSFAGSDELAAQIRRGVRPDVFAAASTALPDQLHREALVDRPVVFATNELVIAVRRGARADGVDDLGARGVRLLVGDPEVPVGVYTREVLGRLDAGLRRRILANVRSEEPDVKGIAGKLAQGAADAGFVYRTDARAAKLRAIALPAALRPQVAYGAAVVRGGAQPALARRFLADLRGGGCARALRRAGFGPAP